MSAGTEQYEALARDEAAVTLARETVALLTEAVALLRDFAARNEATAEWADDALGSGAPAKWIVRQMITASQLTAAGARGEAAT